MAEPVSGGVIRPMRPRLSSGTRIPARPGCVVARVRTRTRPYPYAGSRRRGHPGPLSARSLPNAAVATRVGRSRAIGTRRWFVLARPWFTARGGLRIRRGAVLTATALGGWLWGGYRSAPAGGASFVVIGSGPELRTGNSDEYPKADGRLPAGVELKSQGPRGWVHACGQRDRLGLDRVARWNRAEPQATTITIGLARFPIPARIPLRTSPFSGTRLSAQRLALVVTVFIASGGLCVQILTAEILEPGPLTKRN